MYTLLQDASWKQNEKEGLHNNHTKQQRMTDLYCSKLLELFLRLRALTGTESMTSQTKMDSGPYCALILVDSLSTGTCIWDKINGRERNSSHLKTGASLLEKIKFLWLTLQRATWKFSIKAPHPTAAPTTR